MLDRKIKQNEAQYDLDRKAAKTSTPSSTAEQDKFVYSLLRKFFNKGLKEDDKKEGLLKRLKNIEDKNEEQLKIIGNKTYMKSQIDLFDKDLTPVTIALIKLIKSIEDNVNYDKLSFTGGNKKVYGLGSFKTLEKLIKDIFRKNMAIDEAKIKQNKYAEKLDELRA